MAGRPKKPGRIRKQFLFRLGHSERDMLVARFIAQSPNASEAIKNLIADYMEGRVLDAGGVVEIVQQVLENAPRGSGAPPQTAGPAGKDGQLDPDDPYVQLLKNALPR